MNIKNQDRLNLKIVLLSAAARKKMEENLEVFDIVEKMPVFPGGQTALMEYISQNLRYPAKAHQERIQGRVIAGFVVEKTDRSVRRQLYDLSVRKWMQRPYGYYRPCLNGLPALKEEKKYVSAIPFPSSSN